MCCSSKTQKSKIRNTKQNGVYGAVSKEAAPFSCQKDAIRVIAIFSLQNRNYRVTLFAYQIVKHF